MRDKLWDVETRRLRRSFRLGPSPAEGFADDYACLIAGLLDLHAVWRSVLFSSQIWFVPTLLPSRDQCAHIR